MEEMDLDVASMKARRKTAWAEHKYTKERTRFEEAGIIGLGEVCVTE